MTYAQFLLLFLIPPLLLLYRPRGPFAATPRARLTALVLPLIALAYTTPWDNYLVASGVWSYGADRVLGTIGYVPIEEYLFFVLQPLLALGWLLHLRQPLRIGIDLETNHGHGQVHDHGHGEPPKSPGDPSPGSSAYARSRSTRSPSPSRSRKTGVVALLALAGAGAVMLAFDSTRYLALILVWAAPVLAAQWWFTGDIERRNPRAYLSLIAVPTVYLWIADAVAIRAGIWNIAERYTVGLRPFGLPIEEMTFFLVTNLLSVHGALLFLEPGRLRWTTTSS